MTDRGEDVTEAYLRGAEKALVAARESGATTAVLKARSPSCGKGVIYDGSFTRSSRMGDGVTAALLQRNGIEVISDEEFGTSQS